MRRLAVPCFVLSLLATAHGQTLPDLRVETRGADANLAARLGRPDPDHLRAIVRLTGLEDPGPPIRVVLVPESSETARGTPPWIAGLANGSADTILLFPGRSPRYPHDSLDAVLHHEIAHILIHRAASGRPVPRWFNEGLATVAERTWTFEDRRHLAWALAAGRRVRMEEVDRGFQQDAGTAAQAYAVSSAFVRDLIAAHGIDAPARILAGVAAGAPFEHAFERTTGESLRTVEDRFSRERATWQRWIPLVTSPFVLWTVITLLALCAIWTTRWRRAERRRRWAAEEQEEEGEDYLRRM